MTSDTSDAVLAEGAAPGRSGVVVGHDGSAGADEALREALLLADRLDEPLIVVRAWSLTTAPTPATWEFGYAPPIDDYAAAVQADLEQAVGAVTRAVPDVTVTCRAVEASPVRALLQESAGALMLVVGARGLGGFAELLLGSVSDQCVRYATCPVLVTRQD